MKNGQDGNVQYRQAPETALAPPPPLPDRHPFWRKKLNAKLG